MLTDDVPANNTIWILGDSLLNDASGQYNQFKRKGDDNPHQPLYIEKMYAIKMIPAGMYTSQQAKNMPNILLNTLVDTLNLKAKVPHSLVILINDYRFWNNTDLLTYQMERLLHRFFKEIRRIIEDRNLSLPPRAVNWDYPRIFITKALPLPNNMTKPYPKGFKPNRRKYNRIILRNEDELNYRSINLAEFTSENSNKLFAPDGSITKAGFTMLWTSISDAIHKADNQDRILINKIRAKKLSAQMSTQHDEVDAKTIYSSDPDDRESNASPPKRKKAKRALIKEFNNREDHRVVSRDPEDSPQSVMSEYFTTNNRQRQRHEQTNQSISHTPKKHHHNPTARSFHFNRNRKHKTNWRNKPWWQ